MRARSSKFRSLALYGASGLKHYAAASGLIHKVGFGPLPPCRLSRSVSRHDEAPHGGLKPRVLNSAEWMNGGTHTTCRHTEIKFVKRNLIQDDAGSCFSSTSGCPLKCIFTIIDAATITITATPLKTSVPLGSSGK